MTTQLIEDVNVYHRVNKEWVIVKGRTIDDFFDGQAVVVHRDLTKLKLYTTTDKKTGCRIASGVTQTDSITKSHALLHQYGVETYRECQQIAIKQIEKDRQQILGIQEQDKKHFEYQNREINDSVRRRGMSPITVDMILDMAKVYLTVDCFKEGV